MHIARYVILNYFLLFVSSLSAIQEEAKKINIYNFWAEYLKFSEVTSVVTGISIDTLVKC